MLFCLSNMLQVEAVVVAAAAVVVAVVVVAIQIPLTPKLLPLTALQALASPPSHHDDDDSTGLTDSDTDDDMGTPTAWAGKSPARP